MRRNRHKRLRTGFTTGTAAAAAAKAAVMAVLDKPQAEVTVMLLTGDALRVRVHACRRIGPHAAECLVVKDAGDDPDVTHKAQIGARVSLRPCNGRHEIKITGGRGVGTVTKPGLENAVGEPAITRGPRTMIRQCVEQALADRQTCAAADVEIFVPRGETLAQKTLNSRLGIIGGISILGTTGVVRPLSHAAYLAAIEAALSVAAGCGYGEVVLTTGRRSERFAQKHWPEMAAEQFVQVGDYMAKSVAMAVERGLGAVIVALFFGKALKIAQGIGHTHAHNARLRLDRLAQWTLEWTGDRRLSRQVQNAHTAREAFGIITAERPALIALVGHKVNSAVRRFAQGKLAVRTAIFNFAGEVSFDTQTDVNTDPS